MPKLNRISNLLAGTLLAAALWPAAAMAQDRNTCSVMNYAPPPNGCQRERIEASGRQRPFDDFFPSAKQSAQKSWERQALTKFGERFKSWSNAVCTKVECVKGSIAGMRRCTYSGYACVHNPSAEAGVEINGLRPRQVRRLQTLLRRARVRRVYVRGRRQIVKVDGMWGPVTQAAIAVWLERENMDDTNMTERDVLAALEKRYGR